MAATGYIMLDNLRPEPQQGTYPRRGGAKPSGTCIVHTTEGDWRAGVQSLIGLVLRRADYGCYHQACDWEDIARLYPWIWETWQDSETNNWAAGIAAACRTSDWGNMPADIEAGFYRNMGIMAAEFVTYMKNEWRITVPLKRITGAQARARVPGFCAHGDSGIARSDPGANFDWARFFRCTQEALDNITISTQGGTTDKENDDVALTKAQADALEKIPMILDMLTNIGKGVNAVPERVMKYPVTRKSDGKLTDLETETAWNSTNFAEANDDKTK